MIEFETDSGRLVTTGQQELMFELGEREVNNPQLMEIIYKALDDYGTTVVKHVSNCLPSRKEDMIPKVAMVISRRINRSEGLSTINVDGLTYISKDLIEAEYPAGKVVDVAKDIEWNR